MEGRERNWTNCATLRNIAHLQICYQMMMMMMMMMMTMMMTNQLFQSSGITDLDA